jgi:hypothetical protein
VILLDNLLQVVLARIRITLYRILPVPENFEHNYTTVFSLSWKAGNRITLYMILPVLEQNYTIEFFLSWKTWNRITLYMILPVLEQNSPCPGKLGTELHCT